MRCGRRGTRRALAWCDVPDGGVGGVTGRDALFDLAVNRASSYVERLDSYNHVTNEGEMVKLLEAWALRTRFASRFDLRAIARILLDKPADGSQWTGGEDGAWHGS